MKRDAELCASVPWPEHPLQQGKKGEKKISLLFIITEFKMQENATSSAPVIVAGPHHLLLCCFASSPELR